MIRFQEMPYVRPDMEAMKALYVRTIDALKNASTYEEARKAFFDLQEQNDTVASWSDSTINKIKQVLTKTLVECEYIDTYKSTRLNTVSISPELEDEIRASNDLAALSAFNCFR